jgi:asparagine synthase (glutamine-hydrolysing)
MCGIVGFKYKSITHDQAKNKIFKMLHILQHRGPDSFKVISSKDFFSATARLAIEKIKDGEQPISDFDKKYIISFNGEIFNYKILISKYFKNDKTINTEIKLLLKMFIKKGINFIKEIQGQFSICIYDTNKEKLYLFRDRYGIRPLFFHKCNEYFIYASEIKAISILKKENLKTSLLSLANTSMFWTNVNTQTAFEDIHQVPPGHYLIYSNNNFEVIKYWENPLCTTNINDNVNLSLKNDKYFYNLIISAVKRQIHGEVGFASYLSGGIDSSVLAYLLTKIQKSPINTFSIEFNSSEYDESFFQKEMQKIIKSKHYSIKISKKDIADNFEKVVWHAETHLFRTAPVPMYLLAKLVKEKGHKVIFTGEGADELLLGYDIFGENRIRRFWNRDVSSKKRPELFKRLYNYLPQFKNKKYFEITKDFFKKELNSKNATFYSHLVRWDQFNTTKQFFNFDELQIKPKYLTKELLDCLPKNFNKISYDRKAQILEIETLLKGYLLSSQGDRMSMAHGVEGRYPYLDDLLTEELAKISSKNKMINLKLKNILRNSFSKILPKNITNRSKQAYQAPEGRVFFEKNKNSKLIEEFLDNLPKNKNLNKKNFYNLIKKFKDKNSSERVGFRENMSLIIGLSDHCLQKHSKDWLLLSSKNKINISYEKI